MCFSASVSPSISLLFLLALGNSTLTNLDPLLKGYVPTKSLLPLPVEFWFPSWEEVENGASPAEESH